MCFIHCDMSPFPFLLLMSFFLPPLPTHPHTRPLAVTCQLSFSTSHLSSFHPSLFCNLCLPSRHTATKQLYSSPHFSPLPIFLSAPLSSSPLVLPSRLLSSVVHIFISLLSLLPVICLDVLLTYLTLTSSPLFSALLLRLPSFSPFLLPLLSFQHPSTSLSSPLPPHRSILFPC